MPTVLVTGAGGFIGSHVARALIEHGHHVVAVDDLSGGFVDNVPSEATFVQGSVVDNTLVEDLFAKHRFRRVFHLAAYAAEGLSHYIRRFNYTNNVIGSINLINASVKAEVERFVFTSSIAVYGANQLPMTEELVPRPEDPYGIAKYAVELDLAAAKRQFGLDYTVFRPHNVYGEHQNIGDKYRNVVGIFMNQIMQGLPLTIFGDGTQTRAFSYIDDVAPAIAASPDIRATSGEVYNIGADRPHSVLSLAHVVCHAFGVEPKITFLPERNEVLHAYASHDKAHQAFGLGDGIPLEVGIGRMAEWAKDVGPRSTAEFENVEVWKNFPAGWESAVSEPGQ
ncbi:MAG: NAD-dependent epimerase/dehydratase family protein [Acidobacteria bacterium]|nr:NAD-dependent epimerase/dehydratase family protein [Acidobacteriota bacterium]